MMKTKIVMMSCMLAFGTMLVSCSSDTEISEQSKTGLGSISLKATANTSFTTTSRALTESDYANTGEYMVEIWNSEDSKVYGDLYKNTPNSINLPNGNYTLKVFYGTEEIASRNTLYVYGEKNFTVNADNQALEINCYPTCGRVKAYFDKTMADYFSSYSVVYETQALTATGATAAWSATDTEPWYLKLAQEGEMVKATIYLTRTSDGKSSTVAKEYAMLPGKAWTLNIAPKNDNGVLSGIIITIDESTEDIEQNIVVPSDWI